MRTDHRRAPHVTIDGSVSVADLPDRWSLETRALAYLNHAEVQYRVVMLPSRRPTPHATFYLPGMGGTLEDTPFLEDTVCAHGRLVRVECFGLRHVWTDVLFTTFGDLCTLLRTGAQCLQAIANELQLTSYDIVAHSWGGIIALQTAMHDPRCRRIMPLVSTPDICDAAMRMYHLVPALPSFASVLDRLQAGNIRRDAEAAKFGRSTHQAAWERISPWRIENFLHRTFSMLIYNRAEDPVMLRDNVEHWIQWAKAQNLDVRADFISMPENRNLHDMPLEAFRAALEQFLWNESAAQSIVPFPERGSDAAAAAS